MGRVFDQSLIKIAPHEALILNAGGMLTLDKMVVLHRVGKGGYVTKFALHKALRSFARGKLTFAVRVVFRRVAGPGPHLHIVDGLEFRV